MALGNPVSFRLSDEAIVILNELVERTQLKRSGVVETALRALRDQTGRAGKKTRKNLQKSP